MERPVKRIEEESNKFPTGIFPLENGWLNHTLLNLTHGADFFRDFSLCVASTDGETSKQAQQICFEDNKFPFLMWLQLLRFSNRSALC